MKKRKDRYRKARRLKRVGVGGPLSEKAVSDLFKEKYRDKVTAYYNSIMAERKRAALDTAPTKESE